jgi:pimeloyl-ACP methyl ester carboxylesterase
MRETIGLVLAALLLAACDAQPARNGTSETATSGPARALSADGTRIAYRTTGAGDTALVFVHGWTCDQGYWDAQVPAFAKDHRVVTLDLAGHGASDTARKNWSIPAFGEDVAAVIRALPDKRVILIGHSMGGPVALEAARLVPERVIGVVGVDTFNDLGGREFDPAVFEKFIAELRKDSAGTTRNFVSTRFFPEDADPALKKRIADDMASSPPEVAIGSMEAIFAYDIKPAAAALKVPLVAINADLFPLMNEAAARQVTPSFRLVTMKGVGHFLHMEAPDGFNAALRAEVERIATAS